jgi:tRNA(Ile)-lysidine synthase
MTPAFLLAASTGDGPVPEHVLNAFLQQRLAAAPQVRRLVVGFSGGLDSGVLLHALAGLAPALDREAAAVHVHHGLSPHPDAWVAHAEAVCRTLGRALTVQHVTVPAQPSLEAAARAARRAAFAAVLQPGDALLLAQHRDDQAETLLLRLFRGAGVSGRGAMRAVADMPCTGGGRVPLWRPLLDLPRAQLAAYARDHGMSWVEDESNADVRHARNFLRNDVLPVLHTRWPSLTETLAATARRMQEADALLEALAVADLADCVDAGQRLAIAGLQALPPPRQRLLLRCWLHRQGFAFPGEGTLARILDEVIPARPDAAPRLAWSEGEIRRYRGDLYALRPRPPVAPDWQCRWQAEMPLLLPDGRGLRALNAGAGSIFNVRFRRGGEELRRGGHRRELRILLQDAGIPPWEREHLPLLFDAAGSELLAVAGTALRADGLAPDLSFRLESHPAP